MHAGDIQLTGSFFLQGPAKHATLVVAALLFFSHTTFFMFGSPCRAA